MRFLRARHLWSNVFFLHFANTYNGQFGTFLWNKNMFWFWYIQIFTVCGYLYESNRYLIFIYDNTETFLSRKQHICIADLFCYLRGVFERCLYSLFKILLRITYIYLYLFGLKSKTYVCYVRTYRKLWTPFLYYILFYNKSLTAFLQIYWNQTSNILNSVINWSVSKLLSL